MLLFNPFSLIFKLFWFHLLSNEGGRFLDARRAREPMNFFNSVSGNETSCNCLEFDDGEDGVLTLDFFTCVLTALVLCTVLSVRATVYAHIFPSRDREIKL